MKTSKKKKGNGKTIEAPGESFRETMQHRVDTYEAAMRERTEKIEEAKAQLDRWTAEVLQIRGALGEARETLTLLGQEGQTAIDLPASIEVEAQV